MTFQIQTFITLKTERSLIYIIYDSVQEFETTNKESALWSVEEIKKTEHISGFDFEKEKNQLFFKFPRDETR